MKKCGEAKQATHDNIIQRMRFTCSITRAKDTHSEYALLVSFAEKQLFREGASLLRHKCIAYLAWYCTHRLTHEGYEDG